MTDRMNKIRGKRTIWKTGILMILFLTIALTFGGAKVFAKKKISKNKAKTIAVKHAGFKKSKVRFIKAKYDKKDNEYDILFVKGNYKYDYDIHAVSGKIKSHDKEKIYCIKKTSSKYISVKKAKKIALKRAKFKSSQVIFTKIKMDTEKGKKVYEIELVKGKKEYEYTINAKTGK